MQICVPLTVYRMTETYNKKSGHYNNTFIVLVDFLTDMLNTYSIMIALFSVKLRKNILKNVLIMNESKTA